MKVAPLSCKHPLSCFEIFAGSSYRGSICPTGKKIDSSYREFREIEGSRKPIYKSCNIFDHSNWRDEEAALTQYGRNELQVITDHFQHILNNCGCDVDSAFSEWTELKLHVNNNPHFRVLDPRSLWQRISQEDVERNNYSNIVKVMHLRLL